METRIEKRNASRERPETDSETIQIIKCTQKRCTVNELKHSMVHALLLRGGGRGGVGVSIYLSAYLFIFLSICLP